MPTTAFEGFKQNGNIIPVKDINSVHWDEQKILGAKNLLKYPYKGGSNTNRGITFTDNGDGTLTLDGTQDDTSNNAIYQFFGLWNITTPLIFPPGKYIITTGANDDNIMLSISYGNTLLGHTNEGVLEVSAPNGITYITCEVAKGATIDNVKIYPMVRLATDPDDTYVPYAMTNKELTEKVQGIIDAATNAADFAAFKTAIAAL